MAERGAPSADEIRSNTYRREGWLFTALAVVLLCIAASVPYIADVISFQGEEVPMLTGVLAMAGCVVGLVALLRLYQAGQTRRFRQWLALKLWAGRYWALLCVVCPLTYRLVELHVVRVSALVLLPACVLAYATARLARWLSGRLERRGIFALGMLGLAAPLFYLMACAVEIGAVVKNVSFRPRSVRDEKPSYDFRSDALSFARTLPEFVREAVWARSSNVQFEVFVSSGFVPVAELKERIERSRAIDVSMGLVNADRAGALAFARAVPATSVPNPPDTAKQFNAGVILALCGNDDEVRQHLDGTFSGPLVDGLVHGLIAAKREASYFREVEELISNGHARFVQWYLLYHFARDRFLNLARELIANGSSDSANNLAPARKLAMQTKIGEEILHSPRRLIRHVMFCDRIDVNRNDTTLIRQIKRAALGELPESNTYEQRAAAIELCDLLPNLSLKTFNRRSKPVSGPLTPDEEADIKKIVQQTDVLLDRMIKQKR